MAKTKEKTETSSTERVFKPTQHGNIYGKLLRLPPTRVKWCKLVTPNQKGYFELTFCYPKDALKTNEKLRAGLAEIVTEQKLLLEAAKFSESDYAKQTHHAVVDGDVPYTKKDGTKSEPPMPGHFLVKARIKNEPPDMVGPDKQPIKAQEIKPGMVVAGVVQPLTFDNGSTKGLSLQIKTVQKVKDDGTRWYSGQNPNDLLDKYDDEGDDETENADEGAVQKGSTQEGISAALALA